METEVQGFTPSTVPLVHQVSATMRSIMLSWTQLEQPSGIALDYEIRSYEKEHNKFNSSMARSQTNTIRISDLGPGLLELDTYIEESVEPPTPAEKWCPEVTQGPQGSRG
ncbi:hypothetical protein MJT46_000997 [Ovis ammon polii x Ovis aries]|nr:hypothetical protein MJT46_000997 [Ovis ammon polii x Ovis aries]